MTVKMKRVAPFDELDYEIGRNPTNATMRPADDLVAERMDELRTAFSGLAVRFSKGVAMWQEKGWEWEDPFWDEDPDSWPPLPKLLAVFDQLVEVTANMQVLHETQIPTWCVECNDGKPKLQGMAYATCHRHVNTSLMVQRLGLLLGWREKE